jgi:hypothetical protein
LKTPKDLDALFRENNRDWSSDDYYYLTGYKAFIERKPYKVNKSEEWYKGYKDAKGDWNSLSSLKRVMYMLRYRYYNIQGGLA